MDEIQKVLVKMGRKDLAQKYYEKVAANAPVPQTQIKPNDKFVVAHNWAKLAYELGGHNAQNYAKDSQIIVESRPSNTKGNVHIIIKNAPSSAGVEQPDSHQDLPIAELERALKTGEIKKI